MCWKDSSIYFRERVVTPLVGVGLASYRHPDTFSENVTLTFAVENEQACIYNLLPLSFIISFSLNYLLSQAN